MGPGGEIRPGYQPYRVIDLEPPAAVDDGTVEREDAADIALGPAVEAPFGTRRAHRSERHSAKHDAGDGEHRKDQRLMLPSEARNEPSDCGSAKRGGGEPDADHR